MIDLKNIVKYAKLYAQFYGMVKRDPKAFFALTMTIASVWLFWLLVETKKDCEEEYRILSLYKDNEAKKQVFMVSAERDSILHLFIRSETERRKEIKELNEKNNILYERIIKGY